MATRLILALSYTETMFDKKVTYRKQTADYRGRPVKIFPTCIF